MSENGLFYSKTLGFYVNEPMECFISNTSLKMLCDVCEP